jgi:cyanophycinase
MLRAWNGTRNCEAPPGRSALRVPRAAFLFLLSILLLPSSLPAEAPPRDCPSCCAETCEGTLFICGGGKLSDELLGEFIRLAGGDEGRLAVITTANWRAETAPHEVLAMWQPRTKAQITLLHARNADEANSSAFLEPLRKATGIWLMSGKQTRLIDAYLGTKLLDELRAAQARGVIIGGTSAGAAVMSDVMIAGGTLAAPGLYQGFALLKDSIIDQHFLARKREPRLLTTLRNYPGRVGFGIDEGTALVVKGRELNVLGDSTVSVYLPESPTRPLRTTVLKAGDREDLIALRRAALARVGESFPADKPVKSQVPGKGSLVIIGGGRTPLEVAKKFVELSGGPQAKFVVVPAASERPQPDESETTWLKKLGAEKVVVFHPKSRAEANSPEFLAQLKDAGGIWFGGGRQWRTVDAFEGTAAVEAFHDVLRRGGAIGGSSAGATIQGEYLVRGSPVINTIMMAEGYERGFGFLPGAAIDQHFTQRKRQPDMELLKRTYPQLLGIGIDEGTAVIVRGTKAEVMGPATVSFYPPGDKDSQPTVLKAGETYDLERLGAD